MKELSPMVSPDLSVVPKAEPNDSASHASTSSVPSPPKRKSSSAIGDSDCLICLDKATGKHYGSISCDGCKGFFRRTIRKKHIYICRFNKSCIVDKDMRNSCRSCRFEKCLANGMRPEAVQLERDRLSATVRRTHSQMENGTDANSNSILINTGNDTGPSAAGAEAESCLKQLMEAESNMRQIRRASVITKTADVHRMATTGDVTESMHQQLILMVEWAKQLDAFRSLSLRSQIGLLRHFSAQHLVFCAAFRSMGVKDAVWLTNDTCLPRDAPSIPDVNRVAARVLDHLTAPMRQLHLEEREYVALKAVAFFDPLAKDVEESSTEIETARQHVLSAFEYHVTEISDHRELPHRLANLLLLLPPLMAISRDLVEEAQLAKLFGLANVDELMAELLLPEDAANNTYSHLKSSVTAPSITLSNSIASSDMNSSNRNGPDLGLIRKLEHKGGEFSNPSTPINIYNNNNFRLGSPTSVPTILAPTPIYVTPIATARQTIQQHQQIFGTGEFNTGNRHQKR